jgi:1-deoxy-D-xylulose-5-phosphate reductoisomerase
LKKLSILGSTGSIGTQSLDVIRNTEEFEVVGLSAYGNMEVLFNQIVEFNPKIVSVGTEESKNRLLALLKDREIKNLEIYTGHEGLRKIASDESEVLITSVVGMIGLIPTLDAIERGKTIALANKETLVTAGEIVMAKAKERNVKILPVDSEHSAIFQCLNGESKSEVERLILTASGGPFRGKKRKELEKITVKEALNHPNWSMGKKITIDSATLMNKGLEFIEAKWLFDMEIEKIDVLVHPQSIVHSMVEFVDGSIIAHLGVPDMRIPIQYALTYPNRDKNKVEKLDFLKIKSLSFEEPDTDTFKSLKLAKEAIKTGGTMPAVLNAANEALVELFLSEKIGFLDIGDNVERIMNNHTVKYNPNLEDVLEADRWSREFILSKFK